MTALGGVTLKLATSLDGRIATASGESRWITGELARRAGHELRAAHATVMVGIQTALADDPELTVRLDGYAGAQPARVVLDSRQRLPPASHLAQSAARTPTWIATTGAPDPALAALGVKIMQVAGDAAGRPDPARVLSALAGQGLSSVLIEGGGQVAASFLRAGLVDRIEWFRAPMILGEEGRPGVGALALDRLADAPRFERREVQVLGPDLWERYERV